jgi:hypothetical protein
MLLCGRSELRSTLMPIRFRSGQPPTARCEMARGPFRHAWKGLPRSEPGESCRHSGFSRIRVGASQAAGSWEPPDLFLPAAFVLVLRVDVSVWFLTFPTTAQIRLSRSGPLWSQAIEDAGGPTLACRANGAGRGRRAAPLLIHIAMPSSDSGA